MAMYSFSGRRNIRGCGALAEFYWHAKIEVLRRNGYDSGNRITHKTSLIVTSCTTNPSKNW